MDSQVTFRLPCVKSPSVSAKMIRALVRNRSPRYKAWVAAKIASGEWPLGVTSAEAAKLTPALMPVVCVRRSDCLPTAASKLTDAALDRLILREGLERVWARLDQLTKPSVPAVAA